ncbi:MAG: Na+/H+ antiporter NhaA [Burkholderiales bacterium]|nr:Na+/H+ antiporter NhaA [Burkholderiales bacterium]
MTRSKKSSILSAATLKAFLQSQSAGGILLMGAAALAMVVANTAWSGVYFSVLERHVAGLSVLHWVNDGLMAIFFLLVGLEIKREFLDGELSTWDQRILPGLAALGGIVVPALIYLGFNLDVAQTARGWAVPTATDIAFALGVLAILGSRIPPSLKVFLAALAIIDDLVAVLVIAFFYTAQINTLFLGLAGVTLVALILCNRSSIRSLAVYLIVGALLWFLVLRSGMHATLAGVALAMVVPMRSESSRVGFSPLHRLEHGIAPWTVFAVVPLFGFANAGVSFHGMTLETLAHPVTLGVAAGLFFGKQAGVMGIVALARMVGIAKLPEGASWGQMYGVSLLCGIGFTMSLFIGLLAFDTPELQEATKLGVLIGSLMSGTAGWLVLRFLPVTPNR